jgi:RNA polymerase sigma-70 factor (ECF subfamily)
MTLPRDATDLAAFEAHRRYLIGLAYRILGSRAEAEDAVQDVFFKWRETDRTLLDNARAWLTTACTRHCIDLRRSGHRARVDYIGTWLPEPLETASDDSPEAAAEMASSLSTAFLLLLERLSPKERAAYLLRDIFDMDYADVAASLGVQEATCRKLVSRARDHIGHADARHMPPRARQEELLAAFQGVIANGNPAPLAALLSQDITLCADGGGKVLTVPRAVYGSKRVLAFVSRALHRFWAGFTCHPAEINGGRGLIVRSGEEVMASVTFGYDADGQLSNVYIMRNPDKLTRLGRVTA